MTEHAESNYTKEDLRHFHLSDYEIEEITGHKLGDGEEPNEDKETMPLKKIFEEIDDDVIGKTPTGEPIYKADDPGEMYKPKEGKKYNALLEQTPESLRRIVVKGTMVQRTDNYGHFRRGFIQNDESMARRILDGTGKSIVVENLTEYMALIEIKYGYKPKNSDKLISFIVRPGENFWSPRSGEKKNENKKSK